jgi:hypothetical protein
MFRMIMNQVFGCKTLTRYSPLAGAPTNVPTVRKAIGGAPLPTAWSECYAPMATDEQVHFVKTHEAPEDDAKTVYIVRNGFAAVQSFKHYIRDYNGLEYTIEQIILGETQFRSWGWHLDVWNPLERPNTLLLKYEDLVERPEEEFPKIAAFTGFEKKREWVNQFDKFHEEHPTMFRQGHRPNPELEFTETQQQLFWAMHGDWLLKLGYYPKAPGHPMTRRSLRQAVGERLHAVGRQAALIDLSNRATEMEKKYKRLRRHWWTKIGREIGIVPKTRKGKNGTPGPARTETKAPGPPSSAK